jgi:hypothetical protein
MKVWKEICSSRRGRLSMEGGPNLTDIAQTMFFDVGPAAPFQRILWQNPVGVSDGVRVAYADVGGAKPGTNHGFIDSAIPT